MNIDNFINSISLSALLSTNFLNLISSLFNSGLSFIILLHSIVGKFTKQEIWKLSSQFWLKLAKINFLIIIISSMLLLFELGIICFECIEYITTALGPIILLSCLIIFCIIPIIFRILLRKNYLLVNFLLFFFSMLIIYSISAINIWLSNPNGIEINYLHNKIFLMQLENILINPALIMKFLHMFASGMIFSLGIIIVISIYYIRKNRNIAFSLKNLNNIIYILLSSFALATFSGHERLIEIKKTHPIKFFSMIKFIKPNEIYINEIFEKNKLRIKEGIKGLSYLQILKNNSDYVFTNEEYNLYLQSQKNIPFAFLIPECLTQEKLISTSFLTIEPMLEEISEQQIENAAKSTIEQDPVISFAFLGMLITSIFGFFLYIILSIKLFRKSLKRSRFFLLLLTISWPINLITIFFSWIMTTFSRSPWAIYEILPSHLAIAKSSAFLSLIWALVQMFLFILLILTIIRMIKLIKNGPINEVVLMESDNINIRKNNIIPKNFYKNRIKTKEILKKLDKTKQKISLQNNSKFKKKKKEK